MSAFEGHLVRTVRESILLMQGGLPPVHLEPIECGSCGRPCGNTAGDHFVPVAVILDPHSLAYACEGCLFPLLKILRRLDTELPIE